MSATEQTRRDLRKRASAITRRLRKAYPDAGTALTHANPLELLVATILSAQCTDVRVNLVTKDLFKRYRTAADYAGADREEFEGAIRSTGFFRAKTRSIMGCCTELVEKYGGKVPDSMEELVKLPG